MDIIAPRIVLFLDHHLCLMHKMSGYHHHHHPGDKVTVILLLKIPDCNDQLVITTILFQDYPESSVIDVQKEVILRTSTREKRVFVLLMEV